MTVFEIYVITKASLFKYRIIAKAVFIDIFEYLTTANYLCFNSYSRGTNGFHLCSSCVKLLFKNALRTPGSLLQTSLN